jgi:hypothetical protein
VRKPWYQRKRPKPKPHVDKLALDIASWPEGCWKSPVRRWWVSVRRESDGEKETTSLTGTYADAKARLDEKMKTGRYWVGSFGEYMWQ